MAVELTNDLDCWGGKKAMVDVTVDPRRKAERASRRLIMMMFKVVTVSRLTIETRWRLCVQVWIKGSLDLIERRKKDTSTSTWAKGFAGSSSCHSSIDDPCDETDDVLSKFVPAGQTVAPTFFF